MSPGKIMTLKHDWHTEYVRNLSGLDVESINAFRGLMYCGRMVLPVHNVRGFLEIYEQVTNTYTLQRALDFTPPLRRAIAKDNTLK